MMTAGGGKFYDSGLRNTSFIKETNGFAIQIARRRRKNFPFFGTKNAIFLKEMLLL